MPGFHNEGRGSRRLFRNFATTYRSDTRQLNVLTLTIGYVTNPRRPRKRRSGTVRDKLVLGWQEGEVLAKDVRSNACRSGGSPGSRPCEGGSPCKGTAGPRGPAIPVHVSLSLRLVRALHHSRSCRVGAISHCLRLLWLCSRECVGSRQGHAGGRRLASGAQIREQAADLPGAGEVAP